jgi:hypothetical protein
MLSDNVGQGIYYADDAWFSLVLILDNIRGADFQSYMERPLCRV